MKFLIAALLLLLALPVRAEINEPSFDCDSETLTAVQTLLCEDPVLGAWEGQLAARAESAGAVAAHRVWLRGLEAECGLGGAEKLPLPTRWRGTEADPTLPPNLAASSFPPGEDRDIAVKYRDIVGKKMTPTQISETQKLAREWKPKK